jgi:hypothetical protein
MLFDPMLPKGSDFSGADDMVKLLIQHPLAVKALSSSLPGSTRVTSPVVKKSRTIDCSIGLGGRERGNGGGGTGRRLVDGFDEVALTRMIRSQLCEQMETMVSFLVLTDSNIPAPSASPAKAMLAGLCVCSSRTRYSHGHESFTSGPEFAASASFRHFRRVSCPLFDSFVSANHLREDGGNRACVLKHSN